VECGPWILFRPIAQCAASLPGGFKCCVCHCLRCAASDAGRAEEHCLPENVDRSTIRKQCLSNRSFSGKQWHTPTCQKNLPHTFCHPHGPLKATGFPVRIESTPCGTKGTSSLILLIQFATISDGPFSDPFSDPKGAIGPGIDVFNENAFPLLREKPDIIFVPESGRGG
jgi:hypothetical protein